MGSRLSKARGSHKNETEGTSSEKYEVSYKELSNLTRIRDFISLLLTYPMKLEEEGILKSWISAFSEWKAQLLSTDDDSVIDKPWNVLTQKALRCMEGLVPKEMISKIESGERSIFNINDAIPEAILHQTVDLAVKQLIQTLFSRDYSACYQYIRLLTRNLVEKRCVVDKIVAALEEKHNMFGIDKDFVGALWINASTYEIDAEVGVQEEINTMLAGSFVTEDHDNEEKMGSNRHLVIVVDADSNKKLDIQKVHFPAGLVVLITTEPSTQAEKNDELRITCTMDLNIRTQDHLLPWEVFCSYLDRSSMVVRSSMAIQRIAVEIVKECQGHLLATVLVAKYLKNVEDVKQWEVVLHKLSNVNPFYDYQNSDRIGISRVMVNAFLNIIWEDIDVTRKLCLKFSLFDHKIKNGVQYEILVSGWSSILLDEVDKYILAQRSLRELLDRFVLLEYESRDVYLPVETYDIIKSLHASNPSFIRHGALGLTEPPYIGRWHDLIWIELMNNKICELPQSPDCPKLQVLLLQGNVDLMDIPDPFFNHMPLLQHLDLSSTSIRDLPPSLSKLIQLKKFYLRGCDLFMELPQQIGQLKNLEELNLEGTLITHLPGEIRKLINLQSLTLCFDGHHHLLSHGKKGKQISNSTIIPRGVISNLTQLNYLNISVDPEDDRWNENVNWVFMEILGLKWLETVSIYVPEAKLLKFMPVHKSLNFRLVVGHHMQRFISRVTPEVEQIFKRCDYSIKFVNGENFPNVVKMTLPTFKALYLDRHMTIKSLSDFDLRNLSGLQVCILAECNEMETIVNRGYFHGEHALPNLEFLSVFYMKNLRSICERPNHSFLYLKSIALHTCPMLTSVFTLDSLNNLSLLEEIIIEDCPKVTTLISHDSTKQTTLFSLPRLKRILLLYLPELVNIFNGLHVKQNFEEMVFYYCPKLMSLSMSELSSMSLTTIRGEIKWWEALKWNEEEWGDAGRPNFLELNFSAINEEADMMNQLAAHQETQPTADHNEYPGTKHRNDDGKLTSKPEEVEDLRRDSAANPLIVFTYFELKVITANFSRDRVLGGGEFVSVYKGLISRELRKGLPTLAVAVKVHDGANSHQGSKEWLAEVNFLGRLSHPNVVKLIGYCCEDKLRVLIYEYMSRGSVEHNLFSKILLPMPWSVRMKIALGAAKGLAFLHEAETPVIYRDFKTSSILLDQDYNAKLSDFGLTKDEPVGDKSHVSTRIMGTYVYAAPEYIATGQLTSKSDVYSFGVVLLELLTGRRSFDKSRPAGEQNLAEWALPLLKEKRKVSNVIDPRLEGDYSIKAVHKAAMLAYLCLSRIPKARPLMRDIVDSLESLLQAHTEAPIGKT